MDDDREDHTREHGPLVEQRRIGLLVVPETVAADVAAACNAVRAEERALLDLITAPGFSVERLRQWKLTH